MINTVNVCPPCCELNDIPSAQKLASTADRSTVINELSPDIHRVEEILNNVESYNRSLMEYGCALRALESRLRSINDEFAHCRSVNPIEHIETRIKTTHSLVKKMLRRQIPISVQNMEEKIFDIAGLRVVCSFIKDVYDLTASLKAQEDLEILQIKDYIRSPKVNGYRSYHMIIAVPFYIADRKIKKIVELQFRTIAMDFWASLEHKMRYKKDYSASPEIHQRLHDCAEISAALDFEMQEIAAMIHSLN